MNRNPIQLQILTILSRTTSPMRYSKIQIKDIENDLFNYHLQFLVSKDLVSKEENTYSLTTAGKQLMANIDAKGNQCELFRFSVTVNVVKEENGKKYILAQRRKRHPYFNDVATVAGKVKKGELVEEAAKRKFKEETGLDIQNIRNLGTLRKIRLDDQNNVTEDTVYTICYAENPTGELTESNEFGENMWVTFEELTELQTNNSDIGEYDKEVYRRIENKNFDMFYFEQEFHIKGY